jgi:hypothetical protein
MSARHQAAVVLLTAVACITLSGCGSAQEETVADTAGAFYEAVGASDGQAACAVLAPASQSELEQSAGKPCAQAILDEDVPDVVDPEDIVVFGTMAQVRFAGETTFLTRFEDGWRVVAAACTPGRSRYDCSIKGA